MIQINGQMALIINEDGNEQQSGAKIAHRHYEAMDYHGPKSFSTVPITRLLVSPKEVQLVLSFDGINSYIVFDNYAVVVDYGPNTLQSMLDDPISQEEKDELVQTLTDEVKAIALQDINRQLAGILYYEGSQED